MRQASEQPEQHGAPAARRAPGARDAGSRSASPSEGRSRSPRRHCGILASICTRDALDCQEDAERAAKIELLERSFPKASRERLQRLVEDGTLPRHAFDLDSMMSLHALPAELQERVLVYLESEKIYLTNSRSKSGFLVSACDRARVGALDAKGMGLQDPWRPAMLALAVPKRPQVDLVPEGQWAEQHGGAPVRITVDVSADKEVGVGSITVALALTQSVATVKGRLAAIGVKIPVNKMKLKEARAGFLKDEKTLAFYNIQSGALLHLVYRTRAGVALRRDHSVQTRT